MSYILVLLGAMRTNQHYVENTSLLDSLTHQHGKEKSGVYEDLKL